MIVDQVIAPWLITGMSICFIVQQICAVLIVRIIVRGKA